MPIAGTHPRTGLRVSLELDVCDRTKTVRYQGAAYTKDAEHALLLEIDVKSGAATLTTAGELPEPARAFIRQLGRQLWKQATESAPEQGGGQWSRRVQRWRGAK